MTFFSGTEEFSISRLKDIFLAGDMGMLVHKELVLALTEKENQLIKEETQEIINENMKHGGSPIGFFFNGELFAVAPTFKEDGISTVHPSLEEKASFLRENRLDISQYTTYIAHFLSYLGNTVEDPVTYVANMPPGLSKFSHSLRQFESFVEQADPEGYKAAVYSRDDPARATFFLHYDRVDAQLNRFLFRRITR